MGTKCDIIRDLATASGCGMCAALAADPPRPVPTGCAAAGPLPSAAVCTIAGAANARMRLFASRASPARLTEGAAGQAVRQRAEENYRAIARASEDALAEAYPSVAKAGVRWPDLELCLRAKGGASTGPGGRARAYFGRDDARRLGMNPSYPLGGTLAAHALWKAGKAPAPIPLAVDYAMNPDLFALVVLALLAVVLAVLVWAARRGGKRAASRVAQEAETQRAPHPDPKAKCRAYVDAMERDGYEMSYYRTRCGLPPK
jgi:hypothetical protein